MKIAARAATPIPAPMPAFAPVESPALLASAVGVELEATEVVAELDATDAVEVPVLDVAKDFEVLVLVEAEDVVALLLVALGLVALWIPFASRYTPCLA